MEALFYVVPFVVVIYFVARRSKKNSGTGTGGGTRPVEPPRIDEQIER